MADDGGNKERGRSLGAVRGRYCNAEIEYLVIMEKWTLG